MHSRNMEWKLLKAQLYSYSRTWSRIKRTKKWESRTPNWCNKKMWVASFFLLFNQHGSSSLLTLFEALVFCNWLRTILTFFNSVKICEVKECKIDKHMELGLYRQPVINFQGHKPRRQASECRSKFQFVVNVGKIQFQRQLVFFQPPDFLSPQNNFQLFQLSTDLFNSNNRLSVLFRPLESSVKDKNFQSTSVFYQVVLKNVIRVLQCM